ncbi:Uncharacterized protein PCOAH_00044960 [Plasmodium coatneyi]|uniref:Uncharacterized protein n=1 Tax=Plasmodium coatneyi TaxID=208452 RepID=A0A1B1E3A4_9APIC|nr:Uncharacterized protein PCOAH_00044960 [Plasmodium coatneyi]ANQ09476.1 Uncharacterized protein PCOAH_00044960 [Plasmodium coatneyi]
MEKGFPSKKTHQKIDDEGYTHMINNGNIKNEMEQFCKFFHHDNNNSFLSNDYCEYMNNFFANEDQMYFGAKYHFDSFDKFTNFPVLTPICKLSNLKKNKREYFAKGEKNRYGKNAFFKRIIKSHLDSVEKYIRKLGTRPREGFAQFRNRRRRGENGFPIKSKSVLRKYFNIRGENTRTGKNSQNRGNVVKPNRNDGKKQSFRKIPPKKKIQHWDPQMSSDEKGKFLKRINLHFSNCENTCLDILFSRDDEKGANGLFLLRKRQTDKLEEYRDDKSTKSEGVYRNAQFVIHDKRVQIVSYDDMELYKLMRKRLRDKRKNESGFSKKSRWRSNPYAKKKAIKVLCPRGSSIGGKTDDKHEGDQIEAKVYTLHSPKHVQTDLERNNATQNGNGQLFVNLGRVKYKCLNKYHSLLDYQNGFTHERGENNKIWMEKPNCADAEEGTAKCCSCSDTDLSFSNLQKSCGWYCTEGGTPNGMNSSQMDHSSGNDTPYGKVKNGSENENKLYTTCSTTCTSASKSEPNPIDDDICNDERKDGSVSSEQMNKIYEEGNNDHTNDAQDVGTHFFVKNMVQPLPMGESEQGGICYKSKLSEKVPNLHFKHAQVEEDKLNMYHNERLCGVSCDNQCGRSSNLGDKSGGFPHGVCVQNPERSNVTIIHSQCNYDPLESVIKMSLNEEESKMENTPHEGTGTLGERIPSDPFDQAEHSLKNGKMNGRTNPIIFEIPQLENKQKLALKPKVYWSKRRPFWEEKKKKAIRKGTNTNYHQCGKGSLKNVEDVLTLKGGIHIGCGFAKGEKQPLRNFSLTTDSTCTLSSTPLERRIIRSSGNIQKRSYTTSCINETSILRSRKNLSVNVVSLVDANKYGSMRSKNEQSLVASSGESSTRLSSNRDRVDSARGGERNTEALKTSHSYDENPLNSDLLPTTIVKKDPQLENGSNEMYTNGNENKTMVKSIYTKRLADKKEKPITNTEETTTWGKQNGIAQPVNDNSLYEHLLTRCAPPSGFLPTSEDSKPEELPIPHIKAITQNGHKMNTPFTCTNEQEDSHNKQDNPKVDCLYTNDSLHREGKFKIPSCASDEKVDNYNLASRNNSTQNKRSKKGQNESEKNSTTATTDNQQINHLNSTDKRNIKCEPVWGNHLKWDSFTHSVCPNGEPSKATEQNFAPYKETHLGDPPLIGNLEHGGNYNVGRLPNSERGGSLNGVAISVGDLNGKSQLGKICQDDSPPCDYKERCCYGVADLEQVNKKTHRVEGGTGGDQKGGSYNQVGKLKFGKNSRSGTGHKKVETINRSDYHLKRDLDKGNLSSRTNFPIDLFYTNEKRDTKDVIAPIGRKNLPTSQHVQHFECSFPNGNNCEVVPPLDNGHCDDELPNRLSYTPPEPVNKITKEIFTKKSQNSYLIEWFPGFDIPIGTYGRAILRKALHQKRMTDVKRCDEILSSNGLFPTSRSTFGDMKIKDLYRAAHILGIWNVAEKYCLLACERNGYKREWIDMLKRSGVKITMKALKELRSRYLLSSKNFSPSGKKKKDNNSHAKEGDNGGMDTSNAVRTKFERGVIQPGGPMLEAPSTIRKSVSHKSSCSHDDKAGITGRDCLQNPKCKKKNQTCYRIDEQQNYLPTVGSQVADKKRTPNRLHCAVSRNSLPSEHLNGSNEALLRRLRGNHIGTTHDGSYPSSSSNVGRTDLANTHKDRFSSTPQMSNTNGVGYTGASNHVSVPSTCNSLSKIQFAYSTEDRFPNMVVGPASGTMGDDQAMPNEINVENSTQLQNTCHFFNTNFLHDRRKLIHQNWNSTGTASMGDLGHTAGITIRGDKQLHAGNIPIMGDPSTYETLRNECPLDVGMRSDLFHTGGTSDSFQFWSNSQSATHFVDEYM